MVFKVFDSNNLKLKRVVKEERSKERKEHGSQEAVPKPEP